MLLHRGGRGYSTLTPLDLALQKVQETSHLSAPFWPFLFHSSFPHSERALPRLPVGPREAGQGWLITLCHVGAGAMLQVSASQRAEQLPGLQRRVKQGWTREPASQREGEARQSWTGKVSVTESVEKSTVRSRGAGRECVQGQRERTGSGMSSVRLSSM